MEYRVRQYWTLTRPLTFTSTEESEKKKTKQTNQPSNLTEQQSEAGLLTEFQY